MKFVILILTIVSLTVSLWAQSPADLYNEGVDLLKNQQYEQAIEKFKAAALADAAHKDARLGLANAYFRLQQWDNAIVALKEVMTLDPADTAALEMLAKAQYNAKKYLDAITSLEKLIGAGSDNAEFYALLGNSASANKDEIKAEKAFLKAIELKTTTVNVYHKLAIMYQKQKKTKDAIVVLEKSLPVKEDQKTFYYIGRYSYLDKNYVKAEDALKKAIELDPKDDDSMYYLVKTYIDIKKFEDAATHGEKLVLLKKDAKYYAVLGDAYRFKGDKANALKTYQEGSQYSGEHGKYCTQYVDFMKKQ